jgi:DNA-binding NtrC family response regulator
MLAPTFAIVDDDTDFASMAAGVAKEHGFATRQFHTVADARAWLPANDPDLVLLDMSLPDGSGFDVLDHITPAHHGRIVFVTGSPSLENATRAVSTAATEYLTKPLPPERFGQLLEHVRRRFRSSMADLGGQSFGLIGDSPQMQTVRREVLRVAPFDINVLLTGETGTGKDVVARAIHDASPRRESRFLAVNCGAIPEDLLASQLFGHERGSFTGANQRHHGFFEQAQGGTLFLDEIGDMPQALQVYLLRVLETGSLVRVGGTEETRLNVRIIAATHRHGGELGPSLRQDLYYRLAHYTIDLPPLRARQHDVELLAHCFLRRLNERHGENKRIDDRCLAALRVHPWPGNVRELMGAVERGFLRAEGALVNVIPNPARFPQNNVEDSASVNFRVGMSWRDVEAEMLRKTLAFHGGDKTAAARSLGVSVRTIHNHLGRHE